MNEIFGKQFRNVDELYFNVVKQIKFGEGSKLNDLKAFSYLKNLHSMNGPLCVITDYCYEKKCGPFVMDANEIENFVKDFNFYYGEDFYSTDIIIISFVEKIIWVLFHEGVCWLSKG